MKRKQIEYIEFAKIFAISTIVIYHIFLLLDYPLWFRQLTWIGGTGIHLFFFISGFGLSLSAWKGAGNFFSRRFSKIYIPYFLLILIIAVINIFFSVYEDENLSVYLSHVLIYKMFLPEKINSLGGHLWFISTIFQFYAVFPLVVWLRRSISPTWFLAVSFMISLVYMIIISVFGLDNRVVTSCFLLYFWEFGLGIFFAEMYISKNVEIWDSQLSKVIAISFLGFLLMALVSVLTSYSILGHFLNDFPAFLGYFGVSILIYQILKRYYQRVYSFFLDKAKYSYSIYLIHMLVIDLTITLLNQYGSKLNSIHSLLLIPVIYMISILFFYLCNRVIYLISK